MILPIFLPANIITDLLNSASLDHPSNNLFITSTKENLDQATKIVIYKFLLEYKDSPETLKLYIKELERLILWCQYHHKIDLFQLKREDIINYQKFLQNPQPPELWCGAKVPKLLKNLTINLAWRPYYKNLTGTSIKKIMKIIDSFFNYLVEIKFLSSNPLVINKRRNKDLGTNPMIDRYLELDEINCCLTALSKYALESKDPLLVLRAKYIILLLFYTGLRISEAAKHTMGNLIQREQNWFLAVIGKGKKYREVPIPDQLLDQLSEFRHHIGLPYLPEFKENTPLIPDLTLKKHLTPRRIDQILKWAFGLGAQAFTDNPHKASKLNSASAHWLRHSYVTYLLNQGASLKVVQDNAGHSNVGTTMLYRHVNHLDRHKATRNLSLNVKIDNED